MTKYEKIHDEINKIRKKRAVILLFPSAAISLISIFISDYLYIEVAGQIGIALLTLFVTGLFFDFIFKHYFASYKNYSLRSKEIIKEILVLRDKINKIYGKYQGREKGQQFKKAYELSGRSVEQFEEAVSVGMLKEKNEVFVTAFMRNGTVVRVTAAVGNPGSCSPADNPLKWKEHIEKLKCEGIRQYHNHPTLSGKTRPSPDDCRSHKAFIGYLESYGDKFRSFIVFWNNIGEWKIMEYDDAGKYWLVKELDVSGEEDSPPASPSEASA
jgi:hypothetical protein